LIIFLLSIFNRRLKLRWNLLKIHDFLYL
jgi:hypothetical protein